ncbi:MAG: 30S ribosomal protein S15 [Planctomycetota bacterium]
MTIAQARKNEVIKDFGRKEGDTGSPEVQIAIYTERINALQGHMKEHKHDYHSRRGLLRMVSQRNRLLRYIARTNREKYLDTIKRLGLRK